MPTKHRSTVWSGWIFFAATMLLIIGVLNVLEGIVAIVYRERVVVIQDRFYVVDLASWGVVVLVSGALLVAAAIGVLSARTWARVTAIVLVSLHAVVQVGSLAAYPFWSLLMLGLDIVVLYALTAGWVGTTRIREELIKPTHNGHNHGKPPPAGPKQSTRERPRTNA
ncbi:MAG TPA: hypothetical protein VGL06_25980 [Pseudonocardiaceae bacterium]